MFTTEQTTTNFWKVADHMPLVYLLSLVRSSLIRESTAQNVSVEFRSALYNCAGHLSYLQSSVQKDTETTELEDELYIWLDEQMNTFLRIRVLMNRLNALSAIPFRSAEESRSVNNCIRSLQKVKVYF